MTSMAKCHAVYRGKRIWCGIVSLADGAIQETHTLGAAKRCDFHGDFIFSSDALEKISSMESAFFCIREDGRIDGDYEDLPEWIAARIREQVRLLFY